MLGLAAGVVYNLPMAFDENISRTRGLDPDDAKARAKQNARESRKYTLGPMLARDFLNEFAVGSSAGEGSPGSLSSRHAFRSVPPRASACSEVGEKLVEALNRSTKNKSRCPGFTFTSTAPHPVFASYPVYLDCVPSACESDSKLGFVEFFLDVHADPSADYFAAPLADGSDGTEPSSFVPHIADEAIRRRRDRAWGQHILRVTEIFARQHRVFAFTATVFGSQARLLRWDRAGCIVSEAFDIRQHPESLCEFLWRFSQTSNTGRGHDTTVEAATAEEERLFHTTVREQVRYQLDLHGEALDRAVSEHYQPGHATVICIVVPGTSQGGLRVLRFVVSRPVLSPLHLTGKGTRGYWALDLASKCIVFLKDSWRLVGQKETEGEVIATLNRLDVRNVPALVIAHDIAADSAGWPQCTLTDRQSARSWVNASVSQACVLTACVHYRMILKDVGYSLDRFWGTSELLHGAYDAFQAMQDALKLDSRLHRDISLGNILLIKSKGQPFRRGLLIDWELSSRVDETGASLDRTRTGTWYYMSGRMLAKPATPHTLEDDMESLLWVILYAGLRWLPHNLDRYDLSDLVKNIFVKCERINDAGIPIGGLGKISNAAMRLFTHPLTFTNSALDRWVNTVMDFHGPVNHDNLITGAPKEGRKWSDPAPLQSFWAAFLSETVLPNDDRVSHTVTKGSYWDQTSDTRTPSPSSLSGSSASSSKRTSQSDHTSNTDGDDDGEGRPASKRARTVERSPPTQVPPPIPVAPPSPRRLRARGPDGRTLKRDDAVPDRRVGQISPRTRRSVGVRSSHRCRRS